MPGISLRVNPEEEKFIKEYMTINNLNLSAFAREAILEKIEDDLKLDETRILSALERSRNEESIDHTEVWKELGLD